MNDSDSNPDASQANTVTFKHIATPRDKFFAFPQGFVSLPGYIC